MTEQGKPPLLSSYDIYFRGFNLHIHYIIKKRIFDAITKDQREADIKWMKENCYLKAGRELPLAHLGALYPERLGYKQCQHDMLKKVNGVSFKAVKGWD